MSFPLSKIIILKNIKTLETCVNNHKLLHNFAADTCTVHMLCLQLAYKHCVRNHHNFHMSMNCLWKLLKPPTPHNMHCFVELSIPKLPKKSLRRKFPNGPNTARRCEHKAKCLTCGGPPFIWPHVSAFLKFATMNTKPEKLRLCR